jgi:8-oxo-dGTP diphosphatase
MTANTIRAYYDSLAAKRIGAGLVCRDRQGRVLLVQPTYKPTWEIPGGTVEAGESPAAAAAREAAEELGASLRVGRLLIVDWLPDRPPKTEGLMILFDGGVLADAVSRQFRLPADELAAWRFFAASELDGVLPEHMVRRLRVAMELQEARHAAAYLEHGFPASPDDVIVEPAAEFLGE